MYQKAASYMDLLRILQIYMIGYFKLAIFITLLCLISH